jgi:hypothetical protein
MAVQIGGVAVPTTMAGRGQIYLFQPPKVVRRNGEGLAVTAGAATVVWKWARLTQSEWNWWYTTLLTGLASKAFTSGIRLVNNLNVETAYNACVVHRPVAETVTGADYLGVTVEITQIT